MSVNHFSASFNTICKLKRWSQSWCCWKGLSWHRHPENPIVKGDIQVPLHFKHQGGVFLYWLSGYQDSQLYIPYKSATMNLFLLWKSSIIFSQVHSKSVSEENTCEIGRWSDGQKRKQRTNVILPCRIANVKV